MPDAFAMDAGCQASWCRMLKNMDARLRTLDGFWMPFMTGCHTSGCQMPLPWMPDVWVKKIVDARYQMTLHSSILGKNRKAFCFKTCGLALNYPYLVLNWWSWNFTLVKSFFWKCYWRQISHVFQNFLCTLLPLSPTFAFWNLMVDVLLITGQSQTITLSMPPWISW